MASDPSSKLKWEEFIPPVWDPVPWWIVDKLDWRIQVELFQIQLNLQNRILEERIKANKIMGETLGKAGGTKG